MKKRLIYVLLSIVLLCLITITGLYTYTYFTTGDAQLTIEYEIIFEEATNDPINDYMNYFLTIYNESDKNLVNFDAEIELDNRMSEYTLSTSFITEPINLYAKTKDERRDNGIQYSKKAAVIKASKLSEDDLLEFNEIFGTIKLKMSWIGGKKEIVLTKEHLKDGSILKLER